MSTTARLVTLVAMLAAVLVAGQARAGDHPADAALLEDVQRAVTRYAYFTVFDDVRVTFDEEGVVTLIGHVTQPNKRTDLAERVAVVDGIIDVRNELVVLPMSGFDNTLRYQVARAIYGSSAFWHYAARRHPPIHIIVERGHVTLTGVVDTAPDRLLAEVLASQFGAFSVTNELELAG